MSNSRPETRGYKQLAEAAEVAEGVVETVSESILLLDSDLQVRFANRSFYRTFQVLPQDTKRSGAG